MKPFRILAVAAVALSVSVLAAAFAGCSKKASAQTASGVPQSAQGANGGQNNMQERIQSGLAELVSAGTITQAQADKIQSALTERMGSRPSGTGSGGSRPNFTSGSRPDFASGGSRPDFASGSGQGGRGQGGGFGGDLLSSLVSDGTITQAQADAVTQKLFSSGQNGQGSQSTPSGQSASSSSK